MTTTINHRGIGGTPTNRKEPMAMAILRKEDTPTGDPAPPAEGLTLLPPRHDIVTMVDEKLRLLGRREQFSASEVHDMLLDVRGLANRETLA